MNRFCFFLGGGLYFWEVMGSDGYIWLVMGGGGWYWMVVVGGIVSSDPIMNP